MGRMQAAQGTEASQWEQCTMGHSKGIFPPKGSLELRFRGSCESVKTARRPESAWALTESAIW